MIKLTDGIAEFRLISAALSLAFGKSFFDTIFSLNISEPIIGKNNLDETYKLISSNPAFVTIKIKWFLL